MTNRPPIPAVYWQRILAFLEAGATGQIVIDAHHGRVTAVSLKETLRVGEDEPTRAKEGRVHSGS